MSRKTIPSLSKAISQKKNDEKNKSCNKGLKFTHMNKFVNILLFITNTQLDIYIYIYIAIYIYIYIYIETKKEFIIPLKTNVQVKKIKLIYYLLKLYLL